MSNISLEKVEKLLGAQDFRVFNNTLNLLKKFGQDTSTKNVLIEAGLLEKFQQRAAGSMAQQKRSEVANKLQDEQLLALVRDYLKVASAKSAKNSMTIRFCMKGEYVWAQVGNASYKSKLPSPAKKGEVQNLLEE